ncbi:unnamed protein product [Linum tenue]|uniref:Phytocyanin domain-containing protein n=1 Tax=Linum tenue TaxID=586396 RepID=A0AAV0Q112_9ROSI|nr:unnamed protein product [Linum tenue]
MVFFASRNKKMVVSMFAVVAALAVFAPMMASATQYVVGDETGWTKDFDYTTWTAGKQFFVGDSLVFNYPAGKHNVFKVNGTDFQQCSKPLVGAPLTTGSDEIELKTTGRKWYICGVSGHCATGQKLVITVSDGSAAPAPTPVSPSTGAAPGSIVSAGFAAVTVVVGVVGMSMF